MFFILFDVVRVLYSLVVEIIVFICVKLYGFVNSVELVFGIVCIKQVCVLMSVVFAWCVFACM